VAYYPMWSFQPVAALQAAEEDLVRRLVHKTWWR
jgi:hypothetical protein